MEVIKYEDRKFNIECSKCRALITYMAGDIEVEVVENHSILPNIDTANEYDYIIKDTSQEIIICPLCNTRHVIGEITTNIKRKPYNIHDF